MDPGVIGFLRDVAIVDGDLHVARDDDNLAGELRHEEGHLAVLLGQFRSQAGGDLSGVGRVMSDWLDIHGPTLRPDDAKIRAILQCGRTEAVAWSYAAAKALGIDIRIPCYRGY